MSKMQGVSCGLPIWPQRGQLHLVRVCACVWSWKEKDCITGLELVLGNYSSLASPVATGHTDIQRGEPSGISESLDHVGYNSQP